MSNKQNKLRSLQKQIDALKKQQEPKKEEPKQEQAGGLAIQQHGKLPGLGQSFDEIGKTAGQLRDLIPKKKVNPNPQPQRNYTEDPFVTRMKRWLLYGLTALIGGGAAIMIIVKIIKRIF